MNIFDLKNQIDNARDNNSVLHIKNIFSNNLPTWSNFIKNMNYKFVNNHDVSLINAIKTSALNHGKPTDILVFLKLDYLVLQAIKYNKDQKLLNFLFKNEEILQTLSEACTYEFKNIKTLINLVGNESKYEPHYDEHDVLLLQCEGNVIWKIYSNMQDTNPKQYILEPGDIIFAPRGTIHQVVVTEPRASVIFCHNYDGFRKRD
jgi:mannose-6-phosphate isomerase-like protein (cupin superfamily)